MEINIIIATIKSNINIASIMALYSTSLFRHLNILYPNMCKIGGYRSMYISIYSNQMSNIYLTLPSLYPHSTHMYLILFSILI